jgi:hypothetical protein
MKFIAIMLLIAAIIVGGPVLVIWSLNTLFKLGIPTTLETWAATAILAMLVSGTAGRESK